MSIRMITILLFGSRTAKHGQRQRAVTDVKTSGGTSLPVGRMHAFAMGWASGQALPFIGCGDVHRFAVFCHGSPGHGDAFALQYLGQALVRQRRTRVLGPDQLAQHGLDGGGRGRAAVLGGDAGAEEMLEFEGAARRPQGTCGWWRVKSWTRAGPAPRPLRAGSAGASPRCRGRGSRFAGGRWPWPPGSGCRPGSPGS